MGKLTVIDHPMIQHKLSIMRMKETGTKDFRVLLDEISMLMAYEVTRDFKLKDKEIETPICKTVAKEISGKTVGIVPILRAGLGMLGGFQKLIPAAKVGFIGMYRDETTLKPVEYFCKLPTGSLDRELIVVDPMLATGGSATDAITMIKKRGFKHIRLACLVAVKEGIDAVQTAHPDVDIYVAAVDEQLNENGYIVPGLGDAGDRIFGTR